jgi:putative endonuclease
LNKRAIGTQYEEKAVLFLEKQKVIMKEKNFRCRFGEIDIIGFHEGYLVFFEVKYRKDSRNGFPEEAVGLKKQQHICKTADFYRMMHHISQDKPIRYDVIAICGDEITWHQNAFYHNGVY